MCLLLRPSCLSPSWLTTGVSLRGHVWVASWLFFQARVRSPDRPAPFLPRVTHALTALRLRVQGVQ